MTIGIKLIAVLVFFTLGFSSDSGISVTTKPAKTKSIFIPKEERFDQASKIDYSTFKDLNWDKDNIEIVFEGKKAGLSLPVYNKDNRYYLPFTELIDKIGGKYLYNDGKVGVDINNSRASIDIGNNTFRKSDKDYKLKKSPCVSGEIVYLSMFDITNILDLKAVWDYKNKSISLFYNRDKVVQKQALDSKKVALVRIEDVVASPVYRYGNSDNLEKLRIISDYLYSKNIPFHIAWIPRYVDPRPATKDDTDLANQYSVYNSDFIYTLDYMIKNGAVIGLHGYTHQSGNTASVDGNEFGMSLGEKYVKDRLGMAMDSAKKLDIPFSFFEAPHYQISLSELNIVEEYFDYVYQRYPGVYSSVTKITRNGRTIKYVPTPLDYMDGKGVLNNMLSRINNLGPNVLASFFYHPNIEFDDIKIISDTIGYHNYEYSEASALHQMVKAFEDKGYKFISIHDLQ